MPSYRRFRSENEPEIPHFQKAFLYQFEAPDIEIGCGYVQTAALMLFQQPGQHLPHVVGLIVYNVGNEHQVYSPRTALVCSSRSGNPSSIADHTVSNLTAKYP